MQGEKTKESYLPTYTKGEEIFNMVSHVVGAAFGIAALVLCVVMAAVHQNVWGVVSGAIFGAAMIILYTMSSIYHGLRNRRAKLVFRVFDHCSIFLLIAGTYTPLTLCTLHGALGWVLFGVVWAAAVVGIVLNSVSVERFRKFSMACYICMGWVVILALKPLLDRLEFAGFLFLLAGGVFYTIGAVLYGVGKRKKYIHSVWHRFVLGGSVTHFFAILLYVMPVRP